MISPTGKAEVVLWKSGCSDSTQEKTYPILSQGPWSDIYEDFIPHKKTKYLCKMKMSKLHLTTIQPSSKDFNVLKKKNSGKCKKGIFLFLSSLQSLGFSQLAILPRDVGEIYCGAPASKWHRPGPFAPENPEEGNYGCIQISKLAHFFGSQLWMIQRRRALWQSWSGVGNCKVNAGAADRSSI